MAKSKEKVWVRTFIIATFVSLYAVVSLISTIHVIDFFKLSNDEWLAISLAIGFEIGAAASLASIIALEKMNKSIVWVLFFILTAMQAMGNTYYAYSHLKDFTQWSELFGLIEEDIIYQKRVLSIISGAILPLVALGFIKSLVDYIRPAEEESVVLSEVAISTETETPEIAVVPEITEEITEEKSEIVTSQTIQHDSEEAITEPKNEEAIIEEPIQSIEQPIVEESKKDPVDSKKTREKSPEVIQIGYRADYPEEAIDLGSSQPIEDVIPPVNDNKNNNWHRIFNNEQSPENLK
jgi:hypothetical protein